MYKLLLAAGLLLLNILPNTDAKLALERNVRDRIDSTAQIVAQENSKLTVNTAEYLNHFEPKVADAQAAYFIDLASGQVLLEKNADVRLPMASTTKLMTALIIIEDYKPNEMVTVPKLSTHEGDAVVGLIPGDRLTVYNLLQGLLIESGSDAAITLAKYNSGTEADFVAKMNEKATILGLSNTQFTNPVGWDENGHYSTAHDLTILTKAALTNPTIREIVAKKTAKIVTGSGRNYILTSTNLLLDGHFLGAKTGTTYAAGECLASYYRDDEKEIVGAILNSPDRFLETADIVDWINNNFDF